MAPVAKLSFEESQKALMTQMILAANGTVEKHEIRFCNEDVPTFLDALEKFESESRKTKIMVK